MSLTMHEHFIRIEGHALRVLTRGTSNEYPWFILWPGLGGTADEFGRLMREGSEHDWNVAAIDPPGHGLSDPWDIWGDKDVALVWDAVMQFLRSPDQVVVGGHSAGAYAAVLWANRRTACRGLVLLEGGYQDPFPDGTDIKAVFRQNASYLKSRQFPSWRDFFASERESAMQWDGDVEAMLTAQMVEVQQEIRPRIDLRTANQVMAFLMSYRVKDLPLIACPTLVGVAPLPESLAIARQEALRVFSERVPALEVLHVPKAGHDLLVDNPKAISTAVWTFLGSIHPHP